MMIKLMKTYRIKTLFSTALLALTIPTHAEVTSDIVEISINSGRFHFDDDAGLKDATFLGWGLGLQLNREWRILLNYSRMIDGDTKDIDDLKIQKYQMDGVYTFNSRGNFRPYLVASLGEKDITVDNRSSTQKQDEMFGLGAGLTIKLNPKWFIHSELHSYYNHRRSHVDAEGKIMIAYRFGQGEK